MDARLGSTDDGPVFTNAESEDLAQEYVAAAKFAAGCGYDFADVKCCHGHLLRELLAAHTRPGPYGVSLEDRSRLFREIVQAIRREASGLHLGVRISIFDLVPFARANLGEGGRGVPSISTPPSLAVRVRDEPGEPARDRPDGSAGVPPHLHARLRRSDVPRVGLRHLQGRPRVEATMVHPRLPRR